MSEKKEKGKKEVGELAGANDRKRGEKENRRKKK
jgi:hypothetical protein